MNNLFGCVWPLSPTYAGNDKVVIRRVPTLETADGPAETTGPSWNARGSGLAHRPNLGLAFRRVVRGASGILPSLLEISGVEDVLVDLEALDAVHAVVLLDV